jgi:hypothetical protein
MRSEKAIKDEIEKLEAMKPKVRRYSAFNDDNWRAINAQLDALKNRCTQSDIDHKYPDDDQMDDHSSATEAVEWMMGSSETPPSEDWLPLVIG